MKTALFATIVILAVPIGGLLDPSNIDPAHKFGWGENIGWTNWQHDAPNPGDGVGVTPTHLAGLVWAENVGWINLGNGGGPYANDPANSTTFGVNIDSETGDLFGMAWGENVGWINFDTAVIGGDQARFDKCDHRFFGYAWGENIGWINLNDATHFVAVGPCVPGDLDCDGEVALDDYAGFALSLSGPESDATCSAFDTDEDNDVDLADYAEMQRVFMATP